MLRAVFKQGFMRGIIVWVEWNLHGKVRWLYLMSGSAGENYLVDSGFRNRSLQDFLKVF
jgi:hypothetical protein